MNILENGRVAVGAPGSFMRHIAELPDPELPTSDFSIRTSTPWGRAQSAYYFGAGIVCYGTSSHGGFHVASSLLKQIPDYLQTADLYADGTKGWFEEDCGYAIVVVCFPERFTYESRQDAVATMQRTYPKQWQRFLSEFHG